ncbi:MAG: hypothetical protein H0U57_10440 [Tatlockia sp.]|nr:hypothetical protein [Tatlockia sp.]
MSANAKVIELILRTYPKLNIEATEEPDLIDHTTLGEERITEDFPKNYEGNSVWSAFSFFSPLVPTPHSQLEIGLTIAGVAASTILVFATLSFLQITTFGLTFPLLICAIGIAGILIAGASEFREESKLAQNLL